MLTKEISFPPEVYVSMFRKKGAKDKLKPKQYNIYALFGKSFFWAKLHFYKQTWFSHEIKLTEIILVLFYTTLFSYILGASL